MVFLSELIKPCNVFSRSVEHPSIFSGLTFQWCLLVSLEMERYGYLHIRERKAKEPKNAAIPKNLEILKENKKIKETIRILDANETISHRKDLNTTKNRNKTKELKRERRVNEMLYKHENKLIELHDSADYRT